MGVSIFKLVSQPNTLLIISLHLHAQLIQVGQLAITFQLDQLSVHLLESLILELIYLSFQVVHQ